MASEGTVVAGALGLPSTLPGTRSGSLLKFRSHLVRDVPNGLLEIREILVHDSPDPVEVDLMVPVDQDVS